MMPPSTDQIVAVIEILTQLCFPEITIGAKSASVGIGKKIDSVKLNSLRYKIAFTDPHVLIIDSKYLFITLNAIKHRNKNYLFDNFLYQSALSIFKFN